MPDEDDKPVSPAPRQWPRLRDASADEDPQQPAPLLPVGFVTVALFGLLALAIAGGFGLVLVGILWLAKAVL
jgi:hypothetical protein